MSKLPKPVNATERYLFDLTEKMELILQVVSDIRDRQDKKDVEMTEEEFYQHLEEEQKEEEKEEKSYEDMNKNELVAILAKRNVEFNKRDLKDNLIALAKETE